MNRIRLNELTLDNRGRWPLPIKTGVILGVSLVIVLLGYWLGIKDNFAKLNELRIREQILKDNFEMKQRQTFNINQYRKQVDLLKHRFRTVLSQFLTKNKMPGLLEEISSNGITTGLKFELFAPQSEIDRDFYVELPVKMTVIGSYSQLALFLSHIAEMKQIITVHEFAVKEVSGRKKHVVSGDELVMDISAKIYREKTR